VTVSVDRQLIKVLFCSSPYGWKETVDVGTRSSPGLMRVVINAVPLAVHTSCGMEKTLEIDVLEEEEEEDDDDDDYEEDSAFQIVDEGGDEAGRNSTVGRVVENDVVKEVEEVEEWEEIVARENATSRPSGSGVSKRSAAAAKKKKKAQSKKKKQQQQKNNTNKSNKKDK